MPNMQALATALASSTATGSMTMGAPVYKWQIFAGIAPTNPLTPIT